jgi:hypothetical protein
LTTSPELSEAGARQDALVCWSGELLLQSSRRAGVAATDLAPDVSRLLSAVRLELESDPESVPTAVRRAAVRLVEHLMQRCAIPVPRYAVAGDEGVEHVATADRESADTGNRSVTPFTPSIRLGRMG